MTTDDFFTIRERLRKAYVSPRTQARAETLGDGGFLTEVAGRVILTARADTLTDPGQLPKELADRWREAASHNPYMLWLQGRFVEAEKANRNGALWSTADLQFGEMSVKHGPLNWLHEEKNVIGTIADNALVQPQQQALPQVASGQALTTTNLPTQTAAGLLQGGHARPFMAAVSAVWKWVHPDKVSAIEHAAEQGRLYYSMECVAREMSCESDETHTGCGKSFDYIKAMTDPSSTCEHIQGRTSARRLVDPSFLGGAVIVPPTQPGWGDANVELLRQASAMAEQANVADTGELSESEWLSVMARVLSSGGRN